MARSATRPTCRSRRCTGTRAARASTTAPTRSIASRWRARSCAATSPRRTASRASTCRAGWPARRRLAVHLRRALPNGPFEDLGPAYPGLRNVVGVLPGRLPAIVVAGHYDTSDVPGTAPGGGNGYLGANDGAAPAAAVL